MLENNWRCQPCKKGARLVDFDQTRSFFAFAVRFS
jgi:hypothetical protein